MAWGKALFVICLESWWMRFPKTGWGVRVSWIKKMVLAAGRPLGCSPKETTFNGHERLLILQVLAVSAGRELISSRRVFDRVLVSGQCKAAAGSGLHGWLGPNIWGAGVGQRERTRATRCLPLVALRCCITWWCSANLEQRSELRCWFPFVRGNLFK